MTGATLFQGFGGADLGMTAAGVDVRWGIEYDDEITSVARMNGLHATTADILGADPHDYERVDCLHMSPPCPSFSVAKSDRGETENDLALARKCADFVRVLAPRIVTLENVWGYRQSESWAIIRRTMEREGYAWNCWHMNSADYGVAQTRKRMIVAAVKGGPRPSLPTPTHAENPPPPGLFGDVLPRWVGWYEAVEDLLPSLPETEFAPWQLARQPVKAGMNRPPALLVDPQQTGREDASRPGDEPANGVQAWHGRRPSHAPMAFVVDGKLNDNSTSLTTRDGHEPFMSVTTSHNNRDVKANTGYRVVQMTPRALARFQSFPDTYALPQSNGLACKGIGNAVPPLLMQRLYEHLLKILTA